MFRPAFLREVMASQLFVLGPMVPIMEVRLSCCGIPTFKLASLCNLDSGIDNTFAVVVQWVNGKE